MEQLDAIFLSGSIIKIIIPPLLRQLAALLFAVAIAKDCKARKNGSHGLWFVFTFLLPLLSGIIYFIYSRILVKRKPDTPEDKKKARTAIKLSVAAVLLYIISLVVAIVALITGIASGLAITASDDASDSVILGQLLSDYYDIHGNAYEGSYDVPLYDKDGNKYINKKSDNGFNYYTYFDESGREYDLDLCYISEDGYFYYDKDDSLEPAKRSLVNELFLDEDGNKFVHIDSVVYWDKDGNIIIPRLKYCLTDSVFED